MEPTESALIVAVPETEPAVRRLRSELDTAAGWGVPAHLTVLYPFLPPERIDDRVLTTLGEIFAAAPRFDVTFAEVKWFGDTVLWLSPQPDDGFRLLTEAVWRRFPEAPPYAGAHADVVPHLTVGHDAPKHVLARAAEDVAGHLPIRAAVDAVRLIVGAPEPHSWHTLSEFRLGVEGTPEH
ncbi:2'-5' RNA ligase family protein [Micromonospora robiginosa]|uniref:2'-5' RNA ligase family protein n=1 Tax=Micromonospora robiginosa TaxID=2749844 RepID=A0A7L6AZ20_9ACTN|nr:2'-5' RNA ligase family protein [Micromonospora ferruginea]QLQ34957.1 2'-5' RNA ligase family protein [Micromonospora ferruginea]